METSVVFDDVVDVVVDEEESEGEGALRDSSWTALQTKSMF